VGALGDINHVQVVVLHVAMLRASGDRAGSMATPRRWDKGVTLGRRYVDRYSRPDNAREEISSPWRLKIGKTAGLIRLRWRAAFSATIRVSAAP